MKYSDKILQPLLCLSTHIIKGKLKILETYPKSEEIAHFYPIFLTFVAFLSSFVEQNCHVLISKLQHFITSIRLVNTYNGRKLKTLGTIQKTEDIVHICLIVYAFGDFCL